MLITPKKQPVSVLLVSFEITKAVFRDSKARVLQAGSPKQQAYNTKQEVLIAQDTYIDRFEYPNQEGELPWVL